MSKRVIFGILALVLIFSAIAAAVWGAVRAFQNLPENIRATATNAALILVGSLVTLAVTKHLERRQAVESNLRDKNAAVYEEYVGFAFSFFNASKGNAAAQPTNEVQDTAIAAAQQLLMLCSQAGKTK